MSLTKEVGKMSEEKLKPCPFCGKEPVYIADGKVICVCGAIMRSFNDWKPFTNREAIEAWNRRVADDDIRSKQDDDR